MLLKIGTGFEVEVTASSLYIRVGRRALFVSPGNSAIDWR